MQDRCLAHQGNLPLYLNNPWTSSKGLVIVARFLSFAKVQLVSEILRET